MNSVHAGVSGALTGLLFGCAICLVQAIPVSDALLRIFVLTAAGGWMGVLLAWLNQLLPSHSSEQHEQSDGSQ